MSLPKVIRVSISVFSLPEVVDEPQSLAASLSLMFHELPLALWLNLDFPLEIRLFVEVVRRLPAAEPQEVEGKCFFFDIS